MVSLAAVVVVVAGMRAAAPILVPFLLACFITIIISPLFVWMRSKRVPSAIALVLMIMLMVVVSFGVVTLVSTSVSGFNEDLPGYQERLREKTAWIVGWLEEHELPLPANVSAELLNPQAALRFTGGLLGAFSALMTRSFLIVLTVCFILFEVSGFPAKIRAMPGPMYGSVTGMRPIFANVRRYMAIKTVLSLLTGLLVSVMLAVLGIEYAMLWGVLAFLLNYVPNIGSILAAVPPVILALIGKDGFAEACWVAAGFLAINVGIGNLLEPRVMGQGLGLSTLVVFLSLVFWGWVLGPVGMVLSVPLTMALKIALEGSPQTRWLAVLLGSAGAVGRSAEAASPRPQ
jgi:predicted PurR-regulated permease PerM